MDQILYCFEWMTQSIYATKKPQKLDTRPSQSWAGVVGNHAAGILVDHDTDDSDAEDDLAEELIADYMHGVSLLIYYKLQPWISPGVP